MNEINKIRKENIEDIMDLTDTQKGMLYHYIKDSDTKEYQEQACITITGEIDIEILKKAWKHIIETNEMLRTIYKWDKLDKPVQIVLKNYDIPFKVFDLSKESNEVKDNLFNRILENHKNENINITNESIKITICKIEEHECKMIIKNHHILYDGWSNGIILREFIEAYNCYFQGEEPIKQVKSKFKQLVKWNKQQDKNRQKEYWQKYLKDFEHESNMFNSDNTTKTHKYIGEHTYIISDLTKNKLEVCAKELQVSVAAILYSIWSILQQRYENSEDIIFGMTVSGRTAKIKDIDNIVGMFINTIPLRVKTYSNQEASTFIKSLEESLRAHEEFENTSLLDIKSYSKYNHEKSLFDNIVVIENYPLDKVADKNSKIKIEDCSISETTNFNMTFGISIFDDLEIKVSYNKESFEDEFIITMTKHYENILNEILSNTSINISKIEMISEKEKNTLLYDFNDTYADYPSDKTIHELFEEQVEKTPDNIAIVFEDKELTYRELNERANSMAKNLRGKGVEADSIVGIMVEHSIDMIVGIMGVLKAGGAYLPIDPQYPEDRIGYMLEDSKANILITQKHLVSRTHFFGQVLEIHDEKIYIESAENLKNTSQSTNLAYVIYTSGSTGRPKGVMVEHKALINLCKWHNKNYEVNECDKVAKYAGIGFDASVWEMFPYIIEGASIHIIKDELRLNVEKLNKYYEENGITIGFLPTSIFEQFIGLENKSVKKLLTGADKLRHFKNKSYELYNNYGPTEYTVVSTSYKVNKYYENIPIGKPISNTRVYVLDRNNKIMPIGIPGELCISGDGLARGYLNNKILSVEKFTNNPYEVGQKMYKTGDLVSWLPDGNIEFLGRIDHQVKIRGFRIELGEIESRLLNHESVKEAIVLDREDENGYKYLCAYLLSEKELTVGELREYLSKNLPEYMIPSYFVQLEKMPLTLNGKIDRKALPEPDGSIATGAEYEAPRSEVEEKLVAIWKDILGTERVGINDNFFELGGHSLKSTTLVSKIHKELNVEVPLREIFKFPTIKGISEYIENTEKSIYSSIEIVEEKEYYEASSAQKRMYLLQQFDLKSTGYNMPGVMVIEGGLNVETLEKSFTFLIRRHETLRTSFETIEDKIVQRVSESANFKLECFEVGCIENAEKAVDNIVKDFVKAFDLSKSPLLRVGLIKLEECKNILMFDMHHIISDGVSMGILINEFAKIYEGNKLQRLKIQYKDYSQWQNSLLKSEVIEEQKEYWINRFKDEIPVLNMPTDFQRPLMQSFEGESISFKLDKELTKEIKRISKETGSTMYMVLLSGVNILLSKYSGQEDIIVGSPIAGRAHADFEKIIGMFVNTLAMRNHPYGSKTYEDFLKEVKENALKAYENQDYQFDELVDKLNIPRDISRNPLFDVMFTMQNIDLEEIELKDLIFKRYKQEHKVAKFDLTFSASEVENEIIFELEYSKKLYKRETIERMVQHFVNVIKSVAVDTKIKLSEIDMLTEVEKHKLLYEFNDTYADYPRDKTIHELFEEQVEKTPDNVAVVFEDKKLTYRELNERANRLARNLREKGVKPDSIVAIMVERSAYMIVGIIAILKSGGAYLPIDNEYPEDRIKYILEDSKTKMLLTQNNLVQKVAFEGEIIDLIDEKSYVQDHANLRNINMPKDLAYIIYTSGTTGKPKGAMIEHRNVVRLMFNEKMQFDFNEKDVWTMFHSYCFDFSVWEMYGALLYGGKLVLISKNTARDAEEYLKTLKQEKVTILNQIPTPFYNVMNKELNCSTEELKLRYVIFGGEALKPEMLSEWMKKYSQTKLINMYGITETTVHVTYKEIGEKEINQRISNIGTPIPTLSTYIMDKNLKLQPIGVPGELCVGGEGVGRGYLNNKELTEQKFVLNTYKPEEKIYRSGDLARVLVNGELEYLGRIDHQVKIRGFRIELGEIESQLLNYEEIKETIVLDREDENGAKYLCAYLVSEKELTVGELREYLSKTLPDYMIPSYFVQLDKMPLTPNGKIDRKALPEPDGSIVTGAEYEAARNEVEEKLVAIWDDILLIERVGINDNFFELGGHSLKATTLVSKIHKELNVAVPLREIFKFPTIKGISEYIESTEKSIYSSIEIVEEKEYYEASSAQKRMYMLQQFDLKNTGYNMPGVMLIEGRLNVERLEKSFTLLIKRHETLRTSFETIQDKIVQRINEGVNFKLDYFEVGCMEREDKAVDNIIKDFVKAFELNKAPLLRVGLIKIEGEKYILMFDMHHIISDGVSMEILTNEFANIYDGNKLEQLKIQYKDYSQWQNSLLKSDIMQEQKEYWVNRFSDEIPVLNMPTDFQRPPTQSFEGENISFKLDKELTKEIKRISKETGSTMYMVLLSVVNILLSKYSGQEDIIVGSPIAGRPHADLEKIIGMFVSTLAMRNYPEGNRTYEDFLREVKENALKAYENQDYQFDELVNNLSIPRDISRNPLFDVMFSMQNLDSQEIELKDLVFKGYKQDHKVAKFDLTFSASEVKEEVIFELQYGTKLYKRETIERMVEHFVNILKVVTGDIKIKLSEVEMLTKEEKHRLLYEFNDTYVEYSRDKTIHELFVEQVEKTPDNIAVVFQDNKLTYKELNEKSNSLAWVLRSKGIKSNSIVGIMLERSTEMIIGIMAILKAGGAYLPIDINYPQNRIEYMLNDSKSSIVLTTKNLVDNMEYGGECIDLLNKELFEGDFNNLEKINDPNDLIYVIYTSGTTGNPKGAVVRHQSFTNLMQWYVSEFKISEEDNILLIASVSFDLAQKNIYASLMVGGKLTLANKGIINYERVNKIISENKITIINCAPSMFNPIIEFNKETNYVGLKSLRHIFLGGEPINLKKLNDWTNSKECSCKIVNTYGPTECTDIATFYRLKKEEVSSVPIGKPINNVRLFILDKDIKLVPVGVQGELYIAGEGLARGYLNKPELTAEKFIENPFEIGTKMYRTGDLTRWLADGNIEFLDRIDNQVKIRGFRIELGEIENTLLKHEDIKEAVILIKENKENDKYICAYVACEREINKLNLKSYLRESLPEYMVPSYFVQLEKMPLTKNGKLDRKALPEPSLDATLNEYEAPTNEIEEKLVLIWEAILVIEKVGINDNFFELGGHSLKATTLVSRIHKELNVEVSLREIFKFPTIKGISQYIESTEKSMYSSIEVLEEKEYYEASSAQKRMYLLQQFDLKSTGYNMPGVMVVEGKLEAERLEKSFVELIRRHETLRTFFETIEEKIVQRVNESVNFKLERFELDCIENTDIAVDNIVKEFVKAFDLNKSPLLRVGLIKIKEDKHILMFDMHHIISDGLSMGILINEFSKIYEGNKLEQLKIQYKDYSQWQNNLLKSDLIQEQKEYWINRFKDEMPVLNMPTDFQRPLMQSFEGENISFKLDKKLTKDLIKITKETGSTMYMVLLSGVNILLSKYSGQEDIIVGSPIAGRQHADLEKIIGMFVSTLAMRNYPEGNRTYEDFLKEVKENALNAYGNQDYQFDELVNKLSIPRDISRNPLFDVMFTMQSMDTEEIELKDLVFKEYKQENRIAKFDLTFSASEVKEEIIFELQYSTKLYKKETVERMVEHFLNILKAVARDTKIKLSEIDMLTEGEKHKILYEFNDTYAEYPRDKTIHELFEEQAQKTPDNIAVVFEERKLTYRELNERANRLARKLREIGVRPDGIVGIMAERSIEMIVGIMGILKSGGAYLPIDPEYPEDRIEYILMDSKAKILLTQDHSPDKVDFDGEIINIQNENAYGQNGENLDNLNNSKDLAYIIYTSGSTGNPKGVMVEQKSVIRLVKNTNYISFEQEHKILQTGTLAFDASTFEIWGAILNGLELHVISKDMILNTESMEQYINENSITILWLTASLFNFMAKERPAMFINLRYLLVGGDVLSTNHVNKVIEECRNLKVINGYGPTENTTFSTSFLIDREYKTNIPIGTPISNSTAYIMDKYNKLQSVGVYGELCVGGDGLARGYLNNLELTAEKFIENPFVCGERIYKTGDLVRWLPDGNIEFFGRIDQQVKIRGFRIELGEIESQLLKQESVREAIVLDREDENGAKYLCAYLVSEKELTLGELRGHLSKKLPEYMIPSYFVQLERMPLTPNGKIDKKTLPKPDGSIITGSDYEAPRNEIEEKLVAIWEGVLGTEGVGINDNFFELGGHSLKATKLVLRIRKELNVEVPLREVFKFPTIKETSKYIKSTEKSMYSSIEIVEEKEYYEASSAQKRMYMIQQFDLKSTGYNMPGLMRVEGELSEERLEKSFNELIRRHETLRTSFETIEDKIVQIVNESVNFKLDCFEVCFIENQEKAVDNIVKGFVKAFDLNKAPLLRVGLIKLGEEKHILMFDMHHIISDGVSMGILINEFSKIYEGNKLEQIRIQYKDYSQWQNSILKSDVMKEQKEYWVDRFSNEIPVLNMPTDFQRPLMQSFGGENISFKLDKELTKGLSLISKETGSTMYMVLLSGINILLSKYSGQEDIIVGSPIAGRPHADLEKIIGMFVNTLAMRNYPDGNMIYIDFLKEVKENSLKAYENQDYQFDELVDKLSIPRDVSRNPLFDVLFTMQNMNSEEIELKKLVFKGYKQEHKIAKFDLTFFASEVKGEITFDLQYSTNLYRRETIERMVEHFINILKVVVADTKIKLSEIDVLTEGEKHKLLFEFNDTYSEYPRDKTIHELFEKQVQKNPDTIAVVFEDKELTYRELNERANRLARTLREKGVKADSIVAIMVERSFEMIVGIMAVLKAGGAYLPIDPWYPEERIKYTLTDSNTNILLTQSCFVNSVEFKGNILDIQDETMYSENGCNLENVNTSKNLAYVIYTSGSTGKPKGVIIEHSSSINTLAHMQDEYPLMENDSYLLKTAYTFDVSVAELFGWFMGNGRLVILNPGVEKDPESIISVIEKYKITHINFVPSMLDIFVDVLRDNAEKVRSLKYVFVAGEAISRNLVNKFLYVSKTIKLENIYGPTEAIYVTTYSLENYKDELNVPIGKTFSNTQVYILDRNNKIQPIGVIGELCISGAGLARGYLNKHELTAEKFIESPFVFGERMYKTGDLARWLPDGNIEFLGRIDHQVKIRGFRIELGEIESQLLSHESVKEATVLDRQDENGAKYLCAYLVSEKELTVGKLREYLLKNLPEYMIPSYFVQLDKMPLTPNGKIDRKALPKPDGSIVTGAEYEAARNEVEEKLVAIWKDVLVAERIGINDNFFELGGHSLKATTLVSKIHKALNVEVPLREIFKFPTIKGTSKYIESTEKNIYSSIEIVEDKEYYEASSAQNRMYMLQQFDLKSTGYNMPGVMLVEGSLKAERLEKSFIELIRRHETLRTSFETIEDKIVQRVNESVNFKLNCFEVGFVENQEKAVDNIVKDFVKAFDLSKAPLLRVGLIKIEEDKHILMFDMHHIISDGVSMGILTSELAKLYEGNELEQLRIQYKDYSQWQNSLLESEVMQEQKEYWINRFKDEIPVLNMPTDFIRPTMQSFEGENISFKLDKELTKDLKRISKETGSTMYMVLLSGVNILLSKYSGQEDIIVGSPIAGRPHADLEKIIGMFVNTLAIRNYPEGSRTYEDFLKEVKENALKAYENQDYQFDGLVDKLSIARDISRNPLFDVMFTMQNMDSEDIELKDLIFKGYRQKHKVSKFDLTFSASEVEEEIILILEYCTKLYKRETIERMTEHFINIIKVVAADTKIKLSEIDMLTEGEKHKILYEFNDNYEDYPRDKTIHELFEEQVEKTPDNVAVVFGDKKLTYRELNYRANKLARKLREKGVKADSILGIMAERSLEMVVGMLGILKSGGAYLPIDPEYPEDRIRYMIEDSNTNILLTQSNLIDRVDFHGETIDLEDEDVDSQKVDNLEKINTTDDLAYVIYTSGSTGRPKGVMIEHKSIATTLQWRREEYRLNSDDSILQLFSNAFDGFVTSFYTPIISGSKVVILSDSEAKDVFKIRENILLHKITHFISVPSMCLAIIENLTSEEVKSLRIITLAGESLTERIVGKLKCLKEELEIVNEYGPTENSVVTTIMRDIHKDKQITIGSPKANTRVYIIDKKNKLQSIGVPGEICIAGEGLARGYLNKLELTAEKFIESPFVSGERMYKTGDLARWMPDGNIEFLGRIDHQVKIRGFRIELGEIESQLLNHEAIKETIVLDREDENGSKYLCAYLVSKKELTVGELRKYLSNNLPEYMIPSYFVQLKEMPITPNGKIDRKALPKPDGSIVTGAEYEAPRNELEEKLIKIWSEVLGVEKIGINDNFFELGGHSLKAITLVSKIHKEFDIQISLLDLFSSPTIREVNELIKNSKVSIYGEIKRLKQQEYYELSYAQKRLWIINQLNPNSTAYNMPVRITLFEKVDERLIKKVFDNLTTRHEAFRTMFKKIDGNPVQIINNEVDLHIDTVDLSQINEGKQIESREQIFVEQAAKIFNLEISPLIYVKLVKIKEEEYDMIFSMHHIISDGGSMEILKKEFYLIYNAYKQGEECKLQPLKIQYKDFSSWQNQLIQNEVNIKPAKDFWCSQLSGELQALDLPFSYEPSNLSNNNSAGYRIIIADTYKNKLKDLAREHNTSLFVVMLTTFKFFLSDLTGQKDVLIGTAGFGRNHEDLKNVIGYFVNTTILRNEISPKESFVDLLKKVNVNVLKALEYQNYPIELIIDEMNISYPKISAFFNMLNMGESNSEYIKDFGTYHIQKVQDVKFDIVWYITEYSNGIQIMCNYLLGLFEPSRIELIMGQYVKTLEIILENPNKLLKEFKIVTKKRKI